MTDNQVAMHALLDELKELDENDISLNDLMMKTIQEYTTKVTQISNGLKGNIEKRIAVEDALKSLASNASLFKEKV